MGFGCCDLTASAADVDSATRTFNIVSGEPVSMRIVGGDQTKIKGQATTVEVQLYDMDGNVTWARSNYTLALSTTSATATFSRRVVIYEGQTSVAFDYLDKFSGENTVTVSDVTVATGHVALIGDSIKIKYEEGSPASMVFAPSRITLRAGQVANTKIKVLNEYDVEIDAENRVEVALSSSNASGVFYSDVSMTNVIASVGVEAGSSVSGEIYYSQNIVAGTTLRGADTAGELSEAVGQVSMLPDVVGSVIFASAAYTGSNSLQLGQIGKITIRLKDQFGNTATTPTAIDFYVSSSSVTAEYPEIIRVGAGSSEVTFDYTDDTLGAGVITVRDSDELMVPDVGLNDISQNVEVIYGPVTQISTIPTSFNLERGGVSPRVDIVTKNKYGVEVPVQANVTVSPRYYTEAYYADSANPGLFSETVDGAFYANLSLTIPTGSSRASFYYRNDTAIIRSYSCSALQNGDNTCNTWGYSYSIRVTGNVFTDDGLRRKEAYTDLGVNMRFGDVVRYIFTTPERTQKARHTSEPLKVKQLNQYGIEVKADTNRQIYVRSSAGDSGELGGTTFRSDIVNWGANYVVLYKGDSTVSFYYRDSVVGDKLITAADSLPITPDVGIANAVQDIHIVRQIVSNFLVTNISSPQKQGTPSSVVVVVRDDEGYVVDWYDGTVRFSSDDATAILPDEYTFDPFVDRGEHTFVNAVAFRTPGIKKVTAVDGQNISGEQTNIIVEDGNNKPVAGVKFTQPSGDYVLKRGAVSEPITVSIRDASGVNTNAGMDGFKVRLTTTSQTGQIAFSPGGPWRDELVATIPEGLSFINVYYRDLQMGAAELKVTDWQDDEDKEFIYNDTLQITVGDVEIKTNQDLMVLDAFSKMVKSEYAFSHDESGEIEVDSKNGFESFDPLTGERIDVSWRTEWRRGVVPLEMTEDLDEKNTKRIDHENMGMLAGEADYFAVAQATRTSFDIPEEVVSKQLTTSVSPFVNELKLSATSFDQGTNLSGELKIANKRDSSLPSRVVVMILEESADNMDSPIRVQDLTAANVIDFSLSLDGMENGRYKVLAVAYDGSGSVMAQDLSGVFELKAKDSGGNSEQPENPEVPENPENPENPSEPNKPIDPNKPETPDGGGNNGGGPEVPEVPNSSDGEKAVMGIASVVLSVQLFVGMVALIREAYREVKKVRDMRQELKRMKDIAADKTNFLTLSAHQKGLKVYCCLHLKG